MIGTQDPTDVDDRIVRAIYNAAASVVAWGDPLGGLFRTLNLRSTQLVVVDLRSGMLLASKQPPELFDAEAVEGTLERIREWARVDPHLAPVAWLPVGVVYDSERKFVPCL